MTLPVEIFGRAVSAYQRGQFKEAEQSLRAVLRKEPRHLGALNVLAIVLLEQRDYAKAEPYLRSAIRIDATSAATFSNYGLVLKALGRFDEAIQRFTQAIVLQSNDADIWTNRGTVFNNLKDFPAAIADFERAIALYPDCAPAFYNKSKSLADMRRYDEALLACDHSLAIKPDFAEAWLGRGIILSRQMRYSDADTAFRRAIALEPNSTGALNALARILLAEDDIDQAWKIALRSLSIDETPETKSLVALCLSSSKLQLDSSSFREIVMRALSEAWARPSDLSPTGARLLLLSATVQSAMAYTAGGRLRSLSSGNLAGSIELSGLAEDRLLRTLLQSAPVPYKELEYFFTELRFVLLTFAMNATIDSDIAGPVLLLFSAIARQCFINNYVFAQSAAEVRQVLQLRDVLTNALLSKRPISALSVLAIASYMPLHDMPQCNDLVSRRWPAAVDEVVTQQIRMCIEERRLIALLPKLTEIENKVSSQVREQYEQSPYPQWLEIGPMPHARTTEEVICDLFPYSSFKSIPSATTPEILVAGCGTGRQAIYSSKRFKDAQILAIDLSLTSLGYAQRQTLRLGVDNIRYAQADIMKFSPPGKVFDVIECSGVLHHLENPFAGWLKLLELLRPGGIMLLGFYSEIAREDVKVAHQFIAKRGYRATADDIRKCRLEIFGYDYGTPLCNLTQSSDFFNLSDCRDFLFHVQEHRFSLPEIAKFLADNNLTLLGFEIDAQTKRRYGMQFPADPGMTDLARWHEYEKKYPETFFQMYQFWVQKNEAKISLENKNKSV